MNYNCGKYRASLCHSSFVDRPVTSKGTQLDYWKEIQYSCPLADLRIIVNWYSYLVPTKHNFIENRNKPIPSGSESSDHIQVL